MSGREVCIVPTGRANLASVQAALARLSAGSRLAAGADDVAAAPAVVLPGVGAFGPAREALRHGAIDQALMARVRDGRPTLAICLGMQLLCEGSDESPQATGLGLLPGRLSRFPAAVCCPQLGWNRVEAPPGDGLLSESEAYYFANSYRLPALPVGGGWRAATADHGGRFVAAVERGAVLACQFHPELSSAAGSRLLQRWLREALR